MCYPIFSMMVGMIGFEPMVFCSQSRRDNQASLHPDLLARRTRFELVTLRFVV